MRLPGPARWEQLAHGDVPDDSPSDYQRHLIVRAVILTTAITRILSVARIAVYLDLPIHKIDDPVEGDTCSGIRASLAFTIVFHGRVRDLDCGSHVRGPRMPLLVTARRSLDDGNVRLRFAVRQPNWLLLAESPSGWKLRANRVQRVFDDDGV